MTAQGATKDEAIININLSLDEVVVSQPYHKADIEQAKAATAAFINVLPDPQGDEDVSVRASGSLSWNGALDELRFTGASVSIGASLIKR